MCLTCVYSTVFWLPFFYFCLESNVSSVLHTMIPRVPLSVWYLNIYSFVKFIQHFQHKLNIRTYMKEDLFVLNYISFSPMYLITWNWVFITIYYYTAHRDDKACRLYQNMDLTLLIILNEHMHLMFYLCSSAPLLYCVLSQPVSSAYVLWRLQRRMRGDSAASLDSASLTLSSAVFDQSCTKPAPSARSVWSWTDFPLKPMLVFKDLIFYFYFFQLSDKIFFI